MRSDRTTGSGGWREPLVPLRTIFPVEGWHSLLHFNLFSCSIRQLSCQKISNLRCLVQERARILGGD